MQSIMGIKDLFIFQNDLHRFTDRKIRLANIGLYISANINKHWPVLMAFNTLDLFIILNVYFIFLFNIFANVVIVIILQ